MKNLTFLRLVSSSNILFNLSKKSCGLSISSINAAVSISPAAPIEQSKYNVFILILISEQFIAKRRREFQILVCHKCYLFCSKTNSRIKNMLSSLFFILFPFLYSTSARRPQADDFRKHICSISTHD